MDKKESEGFILDSWRLLDKINGVAYVELSRELLIEEASNRVQKLQHEKPKWSKDDLSWKVALETYPEKFIYDYFGICSGLCWGRNDIETAEFLDTIPELFYISIFQINDNVEIHFVDCEGEFATLMNLSNPEDLKGAVWYADICEHLWDNENALTLDFWRKFKSKSNKVNVCSSMCVHPVLVANNVKEFFEAFDLNPGYLHEEKDRLRKKSSTKT